MCGEDNMIYPDTIARYCQRFRCLAVLTNSMHHVVNIFFFTMNSLQNRRGCLILFHSFPARPLLGKSAAGSLSTRVASVPWEAANHLWP